MPGPDGKPFTSQAVIAGISDHGVVTVSKGYLSDRRPGKKANPTLRHIEALASYFGANAASFVADHTRADEIAERIATLKALADAGVAAIALRGPTHPRKPRPNRRHDRPDHETQAPGRMSGAGRYLGHANVADR